LITDAGLHFSVIMKDEVPAGRREVFDIVELISLCFALRLRDENHSILSITVPAYVIAAGRFVACSITTSSTDPLQSRFKTAAKVQAGRTATLPGASRPATELRPCHAI
jgi:hypothetical protein